MSVLTALQEKKHNQHIADHLPTMEDYLVQLRELDGVVENIAVLQRGRDKKPISCEEAGFLFFIL